MQHATFDSMWADQVGARQIYRLDSERWPRFSRVDELPESYPFIDVGNSTAQDKESEGEDGNEPKPVLHNAL